MKEFWKSFYNMLKLWSKVECIVFLWDTVRRRYKELRTEHQYCKPVYNAELKWTRAISGSTIWRLAFDEKSAKRRSLQSARSISHADWRITCLAWRNVHQLQVEYNIDHEPIILRRTMALHISLRTDLHRVRCILGHGRSKPGSSLPLRL